MRDREREITITPETAGLVAAHNTVLDSQRFGGELEERAVMELVKRLADAPAEAAQTYSELSQIEL